MVVDASTGYYSILHRLVARVRTLIELGLKLGAVIREVAGDLTNGVFHGAETGSMWEARHIRSFAVGRLREFWEYFPRAIQSVSQSVSHLALRMRRIKKLELTYQDAKMKRRFLGCGRPKSKRLNTFHRTLNPSFVNIWIIALNHFR